MKSKSTNEHINYIPEIDVATIQIKLQKYHYKTSSLQRDRFYQMSFLATTVGMFSLKLLSLLRSVMEQFTFSSRNSGAD